MTALHGYKVVSDGCYTLTRGPNDIGSIEFLMTPPFVSTVLRRLCEVLDQASSAAHDFDDLTSTIEEAT